MRGEPVTSVLRQQMQGGYGHLFFFPERGSLHLMPPLLNFHMDILCLEISGHRQPWAPVHFHPQGCVISTSAVHSIQHPKTLAPFFPPPGTFPLELARLSLRTETGRPRGAGSLLSQGLLNGTELSPVKGLGAPFPSSLPSPAPLLLGVRIPMLCLLLLTWPLAGFKTAPVLLLRQ